MTPATGRRLHQLTWAAEAALAATGAAVVAAALATAHSLVTGQPVWLSVLLGAYPAGHLAALATRAPDAGRRVSELHQRIHRQITDRTQPDQPGPQEPGDTNEH